MNLEEAAIIFFKKSYKILDSAEMNNDEKVGRLSEISQMLHESVPIDEYIEAKKK